MSINSSEAGTGVPTSADALPSVKKEIFSCSANIAQMEAQLKALHSLDKLAEKKGKNALGFFVLAVLSIFALPAKLSHIGAAVSAGLILFTFIYWRKWAKKNYPDERYLLAQGLLDLVSRDANAEDLITARIDFSGLRTGKNAVEKRSDRTVYSLEWLLVSGKFADGSKYTMQVSEQTHVKFRKGKVKPKGYTFALTLVFSKKTYGQLQIDQNHALAQLQLPFHARVKSFRAKGNAIRIVAKTAAIYGEGEGITRELITMAKYQLISAYEMMKSGQPPVSVASK